MYLFIHAWYCITICCINTFVVKIVVHRIIPPATGLCIWIPRREWREKQQALMNIRTDLFSKCHNDPDRQSEQSKPSPLQTNTRRSVSCQNKCLYQRERLESWEFEHVETDTGLFWCQHLLFCAPGPCVLWSLKLCMPLLCSRLHFCSRLWIDRVVQSDASMCQVYLDAFYVDSEKATLK